MQEIGNILTNVLDVSSGLTINYERVTKYYDGTDMTDAKADGKLYLKMKDGSGYVRQVLQGWGENFLNVDTMADLRALDDYNLLLVKAGYYKGVTLLGYYNKGEYSLNYLWNNTQGVDDGGSVINVGGGSFISNETSISVLQFGITQDSVSGSQFKTMLLSNYLSEVVIPSEFRFECDVDIVIPITTKKKKIICGANSLIRVNTLNFLDIYNSTEIYNLTLDYESKNCRNAVVYRPNQSVIKVNGLVIKNIKDIDSTRGTQGLYIYGEGNFLNIDNISFENCLKLGNGLITDGAGSANMLYYNGTLNLLGGYINKISVNELHNINSSNQIIYEDTSGIYIATQGNEVPNLIVSNIIGKNFGKRLIKAQCSKVEFTNIYGEVDFNMYDSLSVIGVMSEDESFEGKENKITNVTAKGNISYPIADNSTGSIYKKIYVDIKGDNITSLSGGVYGGFLLNQKSNNIKLSDFIIKASRPIVLAPTLVTSHIHHCEIHDGELILTNDNKGSTWVNVAGNSSLTKGKLSYLKFYNIKYKLEQGRDYASSIFYNYDSDNGNDFLEFYDSEIIDSNLNNRACSIGAFYHTDNVIIKNIIHTRTNGDFTENIGDYITLNYCNDCYIENINAYSRAINRGILTMNSIGIVVGSGVKFKSYSISEVVVGAGCDRISIDKSVNLFNALPDSEKNKVTYYKGNTISRPLNVKEGFIYYDTTINKNIIKGSGNNWITPLTNISTPIANATSADATDLETALVLINELKAKLNAKLEADRVSGQQAT